MHTDWVPCRACAQGKLGTQQGKLGTHKKHCTTAQCMALLCVDCTHKNLLVHDVLCTYALHCSQSIAQNAQCTLFKLHTHLQHKTQCAEGQVCAIITSTHQLAHNLQFMAVVWCARRIWLWLCLCLYASRSCELLRCAGALLLRSKKSWSGCIADQGVFSLQEGWSKPQEKPKKRLAAEQHIPEALKMVPSSADSGAM